MHALLGLLRNNQTRRLTILASFFAILGSLAGCGGGSVEDTGSPTNITKTPSSPNPSNSGNNNIDTSAPSQDGPYGQLKADGILVKFNNNVQSKAVRNVFKAAGAEPVESFSLVDGLTLAQVAPGQTLESAILALQSDPSVAYAEPNFIVTSFATPNDPSFPRQYGLHNTGQTAGLNDADIDAPEAWDLSTGTNSIIAVIDTGVDYNHPDLASNIWTNPGEIANNGVDDDGNGLIDDTRGWDFANNDNNPMDDNRHGTHVAGIIAARGNNAVGVTGVNWSARIMPLKFLTATGSGTTASAIRSLQYAVRMGAKISNNSWGGGARSQALFDAISAANTAGHLFVAAAGNAGVNTDTTPSYPASFDLPNIVSVTATDSSNRLPAFANTGPLSVDLSAPGVAILSTTPNNAYASLSGTSMAAPFASGVAGLVLAANPTLTMPALKAALLNSVDPVAGLAGRVLSGGKINAFNALRSVTTNVSVSPVTISLTVGARQQFTASGGGGAYTWTVSNAAVGAIDNTGLFVANAAGTTSVTVTDNAARSVSATVTVSALAVAPATAQVGISQTRQFNAIGGVAPYTWVTSNPAIASIGATTGLLTGIAAGTVTVTARGANNATATSGTVTIVPATTAVGVAPTTRVIGRGTTAQLIATGGTSPYTWTSANAAIATVGATGLVTGTAAGTTSVIATDSAGVSASATISVRDVQIQSTTQATTIATGSNLQLTATGGVAPYTWRVSSAAIATVSAAGLVTAITPGTVTVTASDADGVSNSFVITVANPNTGLNVTPQSVNVPLRWWVRFTATGGTAPYSWSLSNPAAGTIDATTGWFRAGATVGVTTTIQVSDANGNLGETTAINIITAP